jgi:hypothetical protein
MTEKVGTAKALDQLPPEARQRVELAFNKMIEEEVALAARQPDHDKTHDKVRNIVAEDNPVR